jgi:hypothetical protein
VLRLVFLALLLASPHAFAQAPGEAKKARTSALLAIGPCGDEYCLHPIALLSQGRFLPPVRFNESFEEDANRFLATYFKKDRAYGVFFRGSRVSRVKVREGRIELMTLDARARADAPLPLQEKDRGLATDAEGLPGHPPGPPPVAPSPEEKEQVTQLAKALLKKQGVPAKSIQKLEMTSLQVAWLDDTPEKQLLASFKIEPNPTEASPSLVHSLMLIARPTPEGLVSEFTSYLKSESGEQQRYELFLDHLDLDGDGVDELVTQTNFWESWQYQIHKRADGAWKKVYAGGGGGI